MGENEISSESSKIVQKDGDDSKVISDNSSLHSGYSS